MRASYRQKAIVLPRSIHRYQYFTKTLLPCKSAKYLSLDLSPLHLKYLDEWTGWMQKAQSENFGAGLFSGVLVWVVLVWCWGVFVFWVLFLVLCFFVVCCFV